jgi:sugar phosphate isomerase/epimerase
MWILFNKEQWNAMKHKGTISRREFTRISVGAGLLTSASVWNLHAEEQKSFALRMGGPVEARDPDSWVDNLKRLGYRAAFCPVGPGAKDDVVNDYARAAKQADIIIAEVGAWSNPISPDEKERQAALVKCRQHLALAERIGANCCVNISGSRNEKLWAGPHQDNLTSETFDLIVETTRNIIDEVKPTRTWFTLETMPWAYPDSPDSYLRLIKAIDRKQFAVHLDPVNLVCSPQRYFKNAELIRECFAKLGPYIKSCHGKDILLDTKLTTHLDEVLPGLGGLDYVTFLKELSKYPEITLMLEHLPNQQEYLFAAQYVRSVAKKIGLS